MQITYRFELNPTHQQEQKMFRILNLCRKLYNWALSERQRAYKETGKGLTYKQQQNLLPLHKKENPDYSDVHSQVLQDVLRRLDAAYRRFFEKEAGYPRFKNRDHYTSFTYPQVDKVAKTFSKKGHLYLSGIGSVKMKVHRIFPAEAVSRVNVKYHGGKWYANLTAEVEVTKATSCDKSVGLDMGLEYFVMLSDGNYFETPKHYQKSEKKLARLQRRLSRKKKGSNNRGKAKEKIAKLYSTITNQRRDFLHKTSHFIVNKYGIIAFEDLRIKNMVRNHHLSKSIHDAGWGTFLGYIEYKAVKYGKMALKVSPKGTSQECLCGAKVPKDLSVRVHKCPVCGLEAPRDLVSAKLIEKRGLEVLALGHTA